MKVYVAGPMRGIPQFNFPAFDKVTAKLRRNGVTVVSPAEHDREVLGKEALESADGYAEGDIDKWSVATGFDFAEAMRWDLAQVLDADGIVLLPGWENSTGARYERVVAEAAGRRVYVCTSYGTIYLDSRQRRLTVEDDGYAERQERLRETLNSPTVNGGEERVVDATTGGEKGRKLAQLGAIDPSSLLVLAEVAGFGATKYSRYNYLRGYDWSLSFDALQRHALAFWSGTDLDEESGLPHMAHAAWHALALISFRDRKLGTDDRPGAAANPSTATVAA